jgi:hypothetical protein
MAIPKTAGSDWLVAAASGELDDRTVDRVADPLVRHRNGNRGHSIDLSAVTFVTPFALVSLAAILSFRNNRGGIRIGCPESQDCRQYLAVSGFLQAMRPFVSFEGVDDLIDTAPSWSADTVLPLTRLEADEIQDLHQGVQRRLGNMLRGAAHRPRDLAPILSTIQEACANVFQHARCRDAWLAAQRYLNRYTRDPYVEVAIADAGCGIRESLATRFRNFSRLSDGEVLERMLTEGLSRFEDPNRGTGYWVLQDATRQRDGSFYLRSGSGAVRRPRGSGLQRVVLSTRWPGTQLQVRLTCPRATLPPV